MKLKVIEWNIHGAASMGWNNNYTIPKFVVDRILNEKAEIIILTEFVISKGWDYLQSKFEENNYVWFMTHTSYQNGILIAINKNIEGLDLEEIKKYKGDKTSSTMDTDVAERPDFLQVEFKIKDQLIFIIGTRIRDDSFKNKREQFENLLKQVKSIGEGGAVIIAGDFNHGAIKNESDENYNYEGSVREDYNYQLIRKLFIDINYATYTPDYGTYGRKFSWVMENPAIKIKEDHVITRNVKVTNEDYLWDFVSQNNGYGNLKAADYKTHLKGLPDHAILVADIEL